MKLSELTELTNRELKNILRENQIKNYSKLNKKDLVKKVNNLLNSQNGGKKKNKKYTLKKLIGGAPGQTNTVNPVNPEILPNVPTSTSPPPPPPPPPASRNKNNNKGKNNPASGNKNNNKGKNIPASRNNLAAPGNNNAAKGNPVNTPANNLAAKGNPVNTPGNPEGSQENPVNTPGNPEGSQENSVNTPGNPADPLGPSAPPFNNNTVNSPQGQGANSNTKKEDNCGSCSIL